MKDYPYLFEELLEKFWGEPKTQEYFSNYFGDNIVTKSILLTIVIHELNYSLEKYEEKELLLFKEYEEKITKGLESYPDNRVIVDILLEKWK